MGTLDGTVQPVLTKGAHSGYQVSGAANTQKYVGVDGAPAPTNGLYPAIEYDNKSWTYDPTGNSQNSYRIIWQRIGDRTTTDDITVLADKTIANNEIAGTGSIWHVDGLPVPNDVIMAQFIVKELSGVNVTKKTAFFAKGTNESKIESSAPSISDITDDDGMVWTFDGWYLDDGDETNGVYNIPAKFDRISMDTDVTYYGRYVPKCTVTYVYMSANGAASYKRYGWNPSNQVPLPKGPDGKIESSDAFFAGWYHPTKASANANIDWMTTAVNKNISTNVNQSNQKVAWVPDSENGTNMTLYAVYYQNEVNSYRCMTGSYPNHSLGEAGDIADVVDGRVNEALFSKAYVTATGTANQFVAVSEFFGDTTDPGTLADYTDVGFVISTKAADISTNPTTQGGYQEIVLGHVFRDKVILNGKDYTPEESEGHTHSVHRHFSPRLINVRWDVEASDLYVTPYAKDSNGYIYGNGEKN